LQLFISRFNSFVYQTLKNYNLDNAPPVILLYGFQGLGKTTMLNFLKERAEGRGIRTEFVNAQSYSRSYAYAACKGSLPAFRKRFRTAQLLLLDDVQLLAGKPQTLSELLYTYEYIIEGNGKIIVSLEADLPVLGFLGQGLASRFSGGLVLPLQQPAIEEMADFICYYLQKSFLDMAPEAVQYLAGQVNDLQTARGFLDKLSESAAKAEQSITLRYLQLEWKKNEEFNNCKAEPANIVRVTADIMKIDMEDLLGFKRSPPIVEARQLAVYAIRQLCQNSYPEIGRIFSRGHSAIMSACRQTEKKIAQDEILQQKLDSIVRVFRI
jgi:chromosomal replication initiator protein